MSDDEWEELAREFPDSLIALERRLHVAWLNMRREIVAALGGKRLYRFLLQVAKMVHHE